MRSILTLIATVTALALPAVSFGNLVMFEDFESTAAGNTVDNLTGTVGGTWGAYTVTASAPSLVQDQAGTGIMPVAGGGLQYMDVSDPNRDAFLDFDASVVSQLVDGAPIRLEYDVHRIGGSWGHLFVHDTSGAAAGPGRFQYELVYDTASSPNFVYRALPATGGGARTSSPFDVPPDVWTHISFEHTLGSNNATISVGAGSTSVANSTSMSYDWIGNGEGCCGDGSIGTLFWTISTSGRFLVDNVSLTIVPEPGTFALMIGGLFLLGARRLRRR
jgi:hypothetical protein